MQILKAMANRHRCDMLKMLLERPHSIAQLIEATGITQPAVCQHLNRLVAAGLVKKRRENKRVWCSIADDRVARILEMV